MAQLGDPICNADSYYVFPDLMITKLNMSPYQFRPGRKVLASGRCEVNYFFFPEEEESRHHHYHLHYSTKLGHALMHQHTRVKKMKDVHKCVCVCQSPRSLHGQTKPILGVTLPKILE